MLWNNNFIENKTKSNNVEQRDINYKHISELEEITASTPYTIGGRAA